MNFVYLTVNHLSVRELKINDVGIVISKTGNFALVRFLREQIEIEVPMSCLTVFKVDQTGDEHSYKLCDRCFRHLPTLDKFEDNRIKKGGKITKRPSCRDCRKVKNGVSINTSDRKIWEKSKPADYSPFTCPICNKTTIAGISKVVLDHCHKSGTVRGWVCESCNTGIGRFDDDPEIVYSAIEWLTKDH